MDLRNKVVIISGGTSGIGRASALLLAAKGASVVITGRNRERMDEVTSILDGMKAEFLPRIMDVSQEEQCRALVDDTIKKFGRIDILINNAGISMRALFQDLDLNTFKKVIETNFFGTVYLTKYALPWLIQSSGTVVGISSIVGHRGIPARSAYAASKYAMEGFFETLRTELLNKNVHVLMVSPGFTRSNIRKTALNASGKVQGESPRDENKMMSPEEVAEAILGGIMKRKRDIILTLQGKMVVFLNKWIPSIMDRIVYNQLAREKDSPLK